MTRITPALVAIAVWCVAGCEPEPRYSSLPDPGAVCGHLLATNPELYRRCLHDVEVGNAMRMQARGDATRRSAVDILAEPDQPLPRYTPTPPAPPDLPPPAPPAAPIPNLSPSIYPPHPAPATWGDTPYAPMIPPVLRDQPTNVVSPMIPPAARGQIP